MEPVIAFRDFSFQYRAQTEDTLHDINLTVYPGEKILIAGPSGSGKSTLAHCINGLVPFLYAGETRGSYTIGGEDPAKLGIYGLSKKVGTVLQDTDGQFVGLTVAEDIAFALENDRVEHDAMKQRVAEVAETVDVVGLLHHAPGELSGGQKQRVSMAGVMVDDVDILLFDEPLANLDPATGKRAIDLIDRIAREQQKTVLIIEHRVEDALYRAVDRIVVVSDGRIVADEKPDALLSTDVLAREGIREPLYLTALKYAGGEILPQVHPASLDEVDFEPYRKKVLSWFEKTAPKEPQTSRETVLEIKHLDFSYTPDTPVLQDFGFQIQKGEMTAIVGKNGAGKSTLASVICGFLTPQRGEILLNGEDIAPLSIRERGELIGFVMQNPNQMISRAMIFDEVALGLEVRGVPEEEIKERVHETLKVCGLYPFRNWPISALSFGQKKRVTIASILVMNPEILILDEPTAGQDYRHYTDIMEFVRHIHEEKDITILMITHDMHLMLEYTDRAIVITDGKKIADDTPSRILTDEKIVEQAYLKRTSLYELALHCGIPEPSLFVERFIAYERAHERGGEKR